MQDLYYSFNPGTNASKAPLPTSFEHLLKFVTKDERFITIHNQDELVNINEQLDQTTTLQVSNIIQRVIAQLIGLTDLGWRTIQATLDGALYTALAGDLSEVQTLDRAKIDIATAATHEIIAGTTGKKIHIHNMIFTVAGEVNVTLLTGDTDISGAMDFGGESEPRGMVGTLGLAPLICDSGEAFNITLSAAVQVSGFAIYHKRLV